MVKQMKEQVGKAEVTAPFTGIIDETIADEGQIVSPGATPLFRIVNLSNMFIKADVPEKYLATIKKGRTVKVDLPVLDTMIEATIDKVSNYINPANRTFRVEVLISNKDGVIKPNLTAKLMINDYRNEKAILIPQSIISENSEGKQYVYRATTNGGKTTVVQKAIIETGVKQGDYIEVLKGLAFNDAVVQDGARTVKENQEVEIIK
jgi:RND family efflux transporter MFP subunit